MINDVDKSLFNKRKFVANTLTIYIIVKKWTTDKTIHNVLKMYKLIQFQYQYVAEKYIAAIPIKYYPFFMYTNKNLSGQFVFLYPLFLSSFIYLPYYTALYHSFSISSITQKDQRQIKTKQEYVKKKKYITLNLGEIC